MHSKIKMVADNKKRLRRLAVGLWSMLSAATLAQAQGVDGVAEIVARMQMAADSLHDYTCTFHKRELVGDTICDERAIILKVKHPGHFYLQWTEGRNKGIQAVYVQGRNNNKMTVHLNGLLGFLTVSIDPYGKRALKHNRHPITETGIHFMVQRSGTEFSRCTADPDCRIMLSGLHGKDAWEIQATFPPGKGYYTHIATLIIDRRLQLPVRLTCYGWNNEFLEDYRFENIKMNCGLTERDFNVK